MKRYICTLISNPRPAQALGIHHPVAVFCFISSRVLSVVPAIYWFCKCYYMAYLNPSDLWRLSTTSLWTAVSAHLSFVLTNNFMLKWLIHYSLAPTIIRLISLNMITVSFVSLSVRYITKGDYNYLLHAWIAISCFQTFAYIVQDWITSPITRTVLYDATNDKPDKQSASSECSQPCNKRTRHRHRHNIDLLELAVFAVVPVGIASFFTMLVLLWHLD
ncbi:N-glycosylation protein [Schizosaccharomyces japonicus yFS275]|uniref:N-glycosylation protein n=1 Tax=Schizosaccharomyces japonicus (strain yFS275 / FY16936) TaxID=402676 RepID=B6K3Y3_SCHJY|nr:N-glycosylation protein [Schizosaccharomyces japonicus yFS275]EEB08190.1 N-glycosylation protein [Schizosaccharomyces japonicus yFS275]